MAAQLEQLGNFATVVVLVSAIWVMVVAIQNGMPYLGVDGEFATVGFDNMSNVANAVSTFGFCFYVRCMIHLRSHMLLHLFYITTDSAHHDANAGRCVLHRTFAS